MLANSLGACLHKDITLSAAERPCNVSLLRVAVQGRKHLRTMELRNAFDHYICSKMCHWKRQSLEIYLATIGLKNFVNLPCSNACEFTWCLPAQRHYAISSRAALQCQFAACRSSSPNLHASSNASSYGCGKHGMPPDLHKNFCATGPLC